MRALTSALVGAVFVVGPGFLVPAMAAPPADSLYESNAPVRSQGLTAEEFSSQSRKVLHRAPRRVRIYTPNEPGPNSVRICSSHYEYEHRMSGTVLVPRENCRWSG